MNEYRRKRPLLPLSPYFIKRCQAYAVEIKKLIARDAAALFFHNVERIDRGITRSWISMNVSTEDRGDEMNGGRSGDANKTAVRDRSMYLADHDSSIDIPVCSAHREGVVRTVVNRFLVQRIFAPVPKSA